MPGDREVLPAQHAPAGQLGDREPVDGLLEIGDGDPSDLRPPELSPPVPMSSAGAGCLNGDQPPAWTEPPMTTITATLAPRHSTSRAASAGLWTLQVLLAAVYAFSAFGKLTADAQNVAGFEAMGLGVPGMYVIGALELAGAIAMFVPALTGLAATCFVALMVGAVILTWAIGGGALVAIPATVGVVAAVVAWGRRDGTRRLVAHLRG